MPSGNLNTNQTNLGAKVASSVHPLYTLFKPVWEQLAQVLLSSNELMYVD